MDKIYVIFWTQGGNTQAMAEAVAEGIREGGKEAEVIYVGSVSADVLKDQPVFALGCPAMGAEVLEESEMEPFVAEVETFASGKKIGLFGSYGWPRRNHRPLRRAKSPVNAGFTHAREPARRAELAHPNPLTQP